MSTIGPSQLISLANVGNGANSWAMYSRRESTRRGTRDILMNHRPTTAIENTPLAERYGAAPSANKISGGTRRAAGKRDEHYLPIKLIVLVNHPVDSATRTRG